MVLDLDDTICDLCPYKAICHAFKFSNYQAIYLWHFLPDHGLSFYFLCLKHPLFHYLYKNSKWIALWHSQIVHVSKHVLGSNVFLPLCTQAWNIFPGYILFLLSIYFKYTDSKKLRFQLLSKFKSHLVIIEHQHDMIHQTDIQLPNAHL